MDQILDAPVEDQRRFEYAGFWIRFGAYFIDAILLAIVNVVLALMFTGESFGESNLGLNLLSLLLGVLYFGLLESSDKQGTLGKMAVGIKVGDKFGNRISLQNAIGRYFAKIISFLILGIGFMMAGWDDRKQGLHDKLADTFVFYSN
jgi:uncharacterized RDD family membrane protein YckC